MHAEEVSTSRHGAIAAQMAGVLSGPTGTIAARVATGTARGMAGAMTIAEAGATTVITVATDTTIKFSATDKARLS